MDPKNSSTNIALITTWAQVRGYDQPYGTKPWLVKMYVNNRTLWLDLSATTSETRFYNRVADAAIAQYFERVGSNSVRDGIKALLENQPLSDEE